jgi:hypothetical protein
MRVSILDDIHEPEGAGPLCSGTNSSANDETVLELELPQRLQGDSGTCLRLTRRRNPCSDASDRRRTNMKIIRINADEALWRNSMLPEGIVERWLVADGETAHAGHAVAQVRIESALHDIVAPVTGRLAISAPTLAVIEPGFLLATLAVAAEVAAGA